MGITLIPSSVGDMGRDLLIVSDDPDEPEKVIPMLALAIGIPEPDIDLSATALDFRAGCQPPSPPCLAVKS